MPDRLAVLHHHSTTMQAPSGQHTDEHHLVREHSTVVISSKSIDADALVARIAALETRMQSLSSKTDHDWGYTTDTRTELNRETGARRIRHENIRRDISRMDYLQDKHEEDYFRLRRDFDDLLAAIVPVLAGGVGEVRAQSLNTVRNIVRRRRESDFDINYHADDAPPPRPESPFAVIDAEYNDIITNANVNAN